MTGAVILLAAGTSLLVVAVWGMVRLRRHLEQIPNPVTDKRLKAMWVVDATDLEAE